MFLYNKRSVYMQISKINYNFFRRLILPATAFCIVLLVIALIIAKIKEMMEFFLTLSDVLT